ncbi:hypothetical protein ABW19_dt0208753 [Dactylella cylindrospora]|nr:hypothetical protein ABW19_dt0208753 [Dactylella cylindrospora]
MDDDSDTDISSSGPSTGPSDPKAKQNSRRSANFYDKDLKFPTFWTEVYSPITQSWIAVDPLVTGMILSRPEEMSRFEPKGQLAAKSKQQISYVITYNPDKSARDVTIRYLSKKAFPGKTKGFRMPKFEQGVYDERGELLFTQKYDLFSEGIIKCFQWRDPRKLTANDFKEEHELQPAYSKTKAKAPTGEFPTTLTAYQNHARYIPERHLKRDECIYPGELPVHELTIGKGDAAKTELVYSRDSIVIGKPTENWYKEGRIIKPNEEPLKLVSSRAVTVNRKREIESARREGDLGAGLVGLYAFHQTDLYRPPPIIDGKIPKNAYGNIDCFVPSMVPEGAAHVPYKNAAKLCRRLGIEYAEAITGFEFKNRRAIPRAEGVLCAEENSDILTAACIQDEEERRRKEDGKREQVALATWKRFLIGLRIIERIEEDYGSLGCKNGPDEEATERVDSDAIELPSAPVLEKEDYGVESGGFFREEEPEVFQTNNSISDGHTPALGLGGGFIPDDMGEGIEHNPADSYVSNVPNSNTFSSGKGSQDKDLDGDDGTMEKTPRKKKTRTTRRKK